MTSNFFWYILSCWLNFLNFLSKQISVHNNINSKMVPEIIWIPVKYRTILENGSTTNTVFKTLTHTAIWNKQKMNGRETYLWPNLRNC